MIIIKEIKIIAKIKRIFIKVKEEYKIINNFKSIWII